MKFDESIPSNAFISIINRKHASYINEKVKDENLTYGLYPLLIEIYKNNEIIQEELAKKFQLNVSTIARNLKKLEERGFIKRTSYKRKKIITLTDKGEDTVKKVMDYDEEWDNKIKSILGNEDYDYFKEILIKISNELIRVYDNPKD